MISKTKACTKCRGELPLDNFSKDKYKKDGLCSRCNECASQYFKDNKSKIREIQKEWVMANKERIKKYVAEHREQGKKSDREYYKRNIDKRQRYVELRKPIRNKHRRERKKRDINYKIVENLRTRIYNILRGRRKSESTINLIGCSIEQLKQHLKNQFTKGMTWENYGKWHVDHIVPCSSFNLLLDEGQKKCFHYTNLQPLWASDNLRKWAKRSEEYHNL